MAQIVEANPREAGALEQRPEVPARDVATVERPAPGVGEDEVVVLPVGAEEQPDLGLARDVRSQGGHGGGQAYAPWW